MCGLRSGVIHSTGFKGILLNLKWKNSQYKVRSGYTLPLAPGSYALVVKPYLAGQLIQELGEGLVEDYSL
jgi:hypothetical protein